jgi:DeoR family fructose operon transcriptional repressor
VSSADVAAELEVSEMTIRRDLRRLADEGLARRVPGGASLPGATTTGEPFEVRSSEAAAEKRQIARAAATLLDGASSVALDAGTTVAATVEFLPEGISVISHSMPVIAACTAAKSPELMALGGFYEPTTRSFTGPSTWRAAGEQAIDVAVLSCTAIDASGAWSTNPVDAEIKRALVGAARRVVVLADRHKVGRRSRARFAVPDDINVLVTDAPTDELRLLRAAYAEVLRAG